MFTGLIEEIGAVAALQRNESGARLAVSAPGIATGCHEGESIAVNGCCLTVAAGSAGNRLEFDLLEETLRRTNLGGLGEGSLVNLERALPADGRLGGHFVQGHIDGAAPVLRWEPVGADRRLEIELPREFARYVIEKGSIAIDGISLTVAELGPESFAVWIIPHTLSHTNLRSLETGSRVNLEFDLLAKYLERLTTAPR